MDLTTRTAWVSNCYSVQVVNPVFKIDASSESDKDGIFFDIVGSISLDVGSGGEESFLIPDLILSTLSTIPSIDTVKTFISHFREMCHIMCNLSGESKS